MKSLQSSSEIKPRVAFECFCAFPSKLNVNLQKPKSNRRLYFGGRLYISFWRILVRSHLCSNWNINYLKNPWTWTKKEKGREGCCFISKIKSAELIEQKYYFKIYFKHIFKGFIVFLTHLPEPYFEEKILSFFNFTLFIPLFFCLVQSQNLIIFHLFFSSEIATPNNQFTSLHFEVLRGPSNVEATKKHNLNILKNRKNTYQHILIKNLESPSPACTQRTFSPRERK